MGAVLAPTPFCRRQQTVHGRPHVPNGRLCAAGLHLAPLASTRYSAAMEFKRITIDPAICTGKPCIRGLRFPVARLLGLMASGETREAILKAYPYLESEDIDEALRYAAFLAEDETVALAPAEPAE
jgi:uncharacterized protein (DUF433 family)